LLDMEERHEVQTDERDSVASKCKESESQCD